MSPPLGGCGGMLYNLTPPRQFEDLALIGSIHIALPPQMQGNKEKNKRFPQIIIKGRKKYKCSTLV